MEFFRGSLSVLHGRVEHRAPFSIGFCHSGLSLISAELSGKPRCCHHPRLQGVLNIEHRLKGKRQSSVARSRPFAECIPSIVVMAFHHSLVSCLELVVESLHIAHCGFAFLGTFAIVLSFRFNFLESVGDLLAILHVRKQPRICLSLMQERVHHVRVGTRDVPSLSHGSVHFLLSGVHCHFQNGLLHGFADRAVVFLHGCNQISRHLVDFRSAGQRLQTFLSPDFIHNCVVARMLCLQVSYSLSCIGEILEASDVVVVGTALQFIHRFFSIRHTELCVPSCNLLFIIVVFFQRCVLVLQCFELAAGFLELRRHPDHVVSTGSAQRRIWQHRLRRLKRRHIVFTLKGLPH